MSHYSEENVSTTVVDFDVVIIDLMRKVRMTVVIIKIIV